MSYLKQHYVKISFFITLLLVPIIFAVYNFINTNYFLVFSSILTALLVVWIFVVGMDEFFKSFFTHIISALIFFSGVAHAFTTNDLLDSEQQKKNTEIMLKSSSVRFCSEEIQPDIKKRELFIKLNNLLFASCAFQQITDMQNLVLDLGKARYLDPILGLADSIYNEFDNSSEITCLDIAQKAEALCPGTYKL